MGAASGILLGMEFVRPRGALYVWMRVPGGGGSVALVPAGDAREMAAAARLLLTVPEGFTVHPKVLPQLQRRAAACRVVGLRPTALVYGGVVAALGVVALIARLRLRRIWKQRAITPKSWLPRIDSW